MKKEEKKINVGIYIPSNELKDMRDASRVDMNGPAVLSMARLGLEICRKTEKCSSRVK